MKHKRILTSIAMAALVLVSLCAVGASTLSVSAAQGSSANVQASGIVGAPVGAGAPAAYAVDPAHVALFIRGADNQLYEKTGTLSGAVWTWGPSKPLGAIMTSAPAVTSATSGVIDVFCRGSDGVIWDVRVSSTYTLITAKSIGGQVPVNVGPSACSWGAGSNHVNVFVQGTDGALWDTSNTYTSTTAVPSSWSWQSLGGKLTSAPAATATASPNQIGVFVRGSDGVVWYKHYTEGTGWDSWISVGGQVYAGTSPAAYNWGTSRIGWFVMGTDSSLWHNWKSFSAGGTTNGYENLGGVLTSSPGATSTTGTTAQTTINVFVRGSTNDFAVLWQKSYGPTYTGGWSDWILIGGV